MPNWRADAQALSQRIGKLSATAIADAKASRHDAARMAREQALKLAEQRGALIRRGMKRGKGKK
jgi:hypothetical protein